ncbi:uncharacterized protein LOC118761383 [Octopus sinensis]|uniref:Uncharacterized protein LOC118761383 n=1 Tax=Octopus sinensis TaxID=2607531 RepID=A0A7E6EJH4_9MOLL|nr:uncharacterized protein LOC118761383 [Octopus sinensis]
MDLAKLSRNVSQRLSISSLIGFALFLVLAITILYQDSRIAKMEEKSNTNRFVSKRSADEEHQPQPMPPIPGPGSLYTRWGRTTCPCNSRLVYDGVVGGQFYTQSGGGSNLLCLPNDPIWANFTDGYQKAGSIENTVRKYIGNVKIENECKSAFRAGK